MGTYENLKGDMALVALRNRSRWDGVLSQEELALCQQYGVSTAYDCSQQGWIIHNEDEEFIFEDEEVFFEPRYYPELKHQINANDSEQSMSTTLYSFDEERDGSGPEDAGRNFELVTKIVSGLSYTRELEALNDTHCVLAERVALNCNRTIPRPAEAPICYRSWCSEDAKDYAKIMGNKKVWEHLPEAYTQPITEDTARNLIDIANIGSDSSTQAIFFDGKPVGQIRLLTDSKVKGLSAAEVIYMLDETYWGRGLMSKVLSDFVYTTFANKGPDLIYAWIKPENIGSIKCAERSGFVRDHFLYEAELAKAAKREGFNRYLCYNSVE